MKDLKYGQIHVDGTPNDEPCIVLRAQDVFSVGILKLYYMMVSYKKDLHSELIRQTIDAFIAWPTKKIPDTKQEQLR